MFCFKCGKENAEKSTFCTWCGAKLDIFESSVPTPSVIPQSDLQERSAQSIQFSAVSSSAIPSEAAAADNPEPAPEQPENPENSVPLPKPEQSDKPEPGETEPQAVKSSGWSSEVPLSAPAAENAGAAEKPRKYYTGAHLAICLAVTGVMAAAAGIFAGLYFSVIL